MATGPHADLRDDALASGDLAIGGGKAYVARHDDIGPGARHGSKSRDVERTSPAGRTGASWRQLR